MKNPYLTREIIRHVFASFGVGPEPIWGKGLSSKDFKVSKTLDIEYDDKSIINHEIFVAQLSLDNSQIRYLLVNLSTKDNFEAALIIKMDNLPAHLLRLSYDDEDFGSFLLYDQNKQLDLPLIVQAQVLTGVERLLSFGLNLEPCESFEDLYAAITYLVSEVETKTAT